MIFFTNLGRTVRFCNVRDDDLGIAFGAKSTRLQKGQTIENTTTIHVSTSFNIVQSISNAVQAMEKFVRVNVFGIGSNAILLGFHVHVGIHGLNGLGSTATFRLLHVIRPEKELTVQVASFNVVHVRDDDFAVGRGAEADHGKVLQ